MVKKFIGVYGNRANPDGIWQERLSSQDNVMNNYTTGVLQIKLNLQPQETKRIKFTLGVEKSVESAAEATKKIF